MLIVVGGDAFGHFLGSRDYELVDVPPADGDKYKFPYDRRPSRQRFMENFEKFQPFPYDRHDGKGYARNDEVDLEAMKKHYPHYVNGELSNGHKAAEEVPEGVPADDN